ncbi:uncharacterized protein DNG_03787 [Cephalotrichum gorgonifer]|uniref:Subtilisin-like serine protease n=1 Tax=Cephalotrichum gorgonifer TaxID=2041049 RepID=A0AAE8MVP3_9PEZI|nr:uncharacterized protein DNG_03787 [Cephalotrichum gorgonifer]
MVKSNDAVKTSGQSCPFSVRPLLRQRQKPQPCKDSSPSSDSSSGIIPKLHRQSQDQNDDLADLLPASFRDDSNYVASPARQVVDWLERELDLQRLSRVQGLLWFAGLPLPPRALHLQLLLHRDIVVAEQMDMHLVWTDGRIFIKPLPRFLLDPRFWASYLCCLSNCCCAAGAAQGGRVIVRKCQQKSLRERAAGFLFSYAALISHESDFYIAVEKHLLPPGVEWPDWRTLVDELNLEEIHRRVDPRFYHGELRLSRLNKIYGMWVTPGHGYLPRWNLYNAFFRDNFSWLAASTIYIALVLTAMQVGQGTDLLASSDAFASVSYGFAIFSILGPLICAALIFVIFALVYAYNWVKSRRFYRSELQKISQLSSSAGP